MTCRFAGGAHPRASVASLTLGIIFYLTARRERQGFFGEMRSFFLLTARRERQSFFEERYPLFFTARRERQKRMFPISGRADKEGETREICRSPLNFVRKAQGGLQRGACARFPGGDLRSGRTDEGNSSYAPGFAASESEALTNVTTRCGNGMLRPAASIAGLSCALMVQ